MRWKVDQNLSVWSILFLDAVVPHKVKNLQDVAMETIRINRS